jgi:hypothetical protein
MGDPRMIPGGHMAFSRMAGFPGLPGGQLFYTLQVLAGVIFIWLVTTWHLWVIGQGKHTVSVLTNRHMLL